jgi:hypothetical protein
MKEELGGRPVDARSDALLSNVGFLGRVAGRFGQFRESGPIPRKGVGILAHTALPPFPPPEASPWPMPSPGLDLGPVPFSGRFSEQLAMPPDSARGARAISDQFIHY